MINEQQYGERTCVGMSTQILIYSNSTLKSLTLLKIQNTSRLLPKRNCLNFLAIHSPFCHLSEKNAPTKFTSKVFWNVILDGCYGMKRTQTLVSLMSMCIGVLAYLKLSSDDKSMHVLKSVQPVVKWTCRQRYSSAASSLVKQHISASEEAIPGGGGGGGS